MHDKLIDHLKSLHTGAIDARNGYREALDDAGKHDLTTLFGTMIALHQANADGLAAILSRLGEQAEPDGSFMSTVHKTIMSVRSLFGGLDESVLPGLIDGETRNVTHYDETLALGSLEPHIEQTLGAQRNHLQAAIAEMQAAKVTAR